MKPSDELTEKELIDILGYTTKAGTYVAYSDIKRVGVDFITTSEGEITVSENVASMFLAGKQRYEHYKLMMSGVGVKSVIEEEGTNILNSHLADSITKLNTAIDDLTRFSVNTRKTLTGAINEVSRKNEELVSSINATISFIESNDLPKIKEAFHVRITDLNDLKDDISPIRAELTTLLANLKTLFKD